MIPEIDAELLFGGDPKALADVKDAAKNIGFFTLSNTSISANEVQKTLDSYKAFFKSDISVKEQVDMAATGSNRGWGRSGSERVDENSNPDYKEFFDCGVVVDQADPQAHLSVYAPNLWPSSPPNFQMEIESYFSKAREVSFDLLRAVAISLDKDADFFTDKFSKPMALLRGNYYPQRPDYATEKDFGIAPHTDYGCLTLLATDGCPGLEVQLLDGSWASVSSKPGTFVINFGEMLEIWTGGQVRATLHRVIGGSQERVSIPLFFNPNYDTNVAPLNADPISAGEHLSKRFNETYEHLKT